MAWLENLQQRWKVKGVWQVIAILLAFACTGFSVLYLMRPILYYFFGNEIPVWAKVLYYIFILPIYNLILLFYGFIFGQFHFFVEFEMRFFKRLRSLFVKK
jgi:hypothetical protein